MHYFHGRKRNDYEEMLLHHIVTATLYVGYLQSNFTCIGTLIAFEQDLADVLVQLSKMFSSTRFKKLTISLFLSMVVVWAYTRLYVLPMLIYSIVSDLIPNHMVHTDPSWLFTSYVYLMSGFLTCIYLLCIWWFMLFLKMIAEIVTTGKAEDGQQRVESSKED